MIPPLAWCEHWDEKYALLHRCFAESREREKTKRSWKFLERCPSMQHIRDKVNQRALHAHTTKTQGAVAMVKMRRCIVDTWDTFSKPSIDPSDFMRPNPEDVFTICTIEGRGRGIIANRDMSYGETVLKEAPLLMMPPKGSVPRMFCILPRESLESILLLHNERLEFPEVWAWERGTAGYLMHYLTGIWTTNSLDLANECAELSVLLLKGSLFNHSAHPNVVPVWDTSANEMEFVTCAEIKKGEELLIDYAPNGWGAKRPDWYKGEIV